MSQQSTKPLRALALNQVFLGIMLLMLSAVFVSWYFDIPERRLGAGSGAAASLLCGIAAFASSWLLYHRKPYATSLYAASWFLNIAGWIAIGLLSKSRPLWWVLSTAACLVYFGGVTTWRVRRELKATVSHPNYRLERP